MTLKIDFSPRAAWRSFFQYTRISDFDQAVRRPERLLMCHDASGLPQWYLLDANTGDTRQLTFGERGTTLAAISADGNTIYYLEDTQGDSIGHLFRMAIDDGTPIDMTPDWPAYACMYLSECASGNFFGFMTFNQMGFQMFVLDTNTYGSPHLRYESEEPAMGPLMSYDAELGVMAGTEEKRFVLESYDVRKDERVQRLASLYLTVPMGFINREHDMRCLIRVIRAGYYRLAVWNARTGERRDLELDGINGDVTLLDWSSDGDTLIYNVTSTDGSDTWQHILSSATTTRLSQFDQQCVGKTHWHGTDLIALVEDTLTPPRVLRQDKVIFPPAHSSEGAELLAALPITRTTDRYITTYAQPATTRIVILNQTINHGHMAQYYPTVSAWLLAGASVTTIFSLINDGMTKTTESASAAILRERAFFKQQADEQVGLFQRDTPKPFLIGNHMAGSSLLLNAPWYEQSAAGLILLNPFVNFHGLRSELSRSEVTLLDELLGSPTGNYNNVSPRHIATRINVPLLVIYTTDDDPEITTAIQEWLKLLQARTLDVQFYTYTRAMPHFEEQIQAWMMAWVAQRSTD